MNAPTPAKGNRLALTPQRCVAMEKRPLAVPTEVFQHQQRLPRSPASTVFLAEKLYDEGMTWSCACRQKEPVLASLSNSTTRMSEELKLLKKTGRSTTSSIASMAAVPLATAHRSKKKKTRRVTFKHARTIGWCLYKSSIASHSSSTAVHP